MTKSIIVAVLALAFLLLPSVSFAVQADSVGDVFVTSKIFTYVSGFFDGLFSNTLNVTGMAINNVSEKSVRAQAGTIYYVNATSGNDSWSGTLSEPNGELTDGPWKTIQHAADTAQAGDHVIVKAGVYNEFVKIQNSGEEGNPIIFEGERGAGGEWLTIVDPSTAINSGWVAAPEVGAGVYKQVLGFEPYEMMVDLKSISRVMNAYMDSGDGFAHLALAADANFPVGDPVVPIWGTVKWWDGLEAMYGYIAATGTTYIRFRNGDDPNNKSIRATPNGGFPISPKQPAIYIWIADYITVKNFHARGAYYGISIVRGDNNIVEDNFVQNGFVGIGIENVISDNNIIRNNEITWNYYGYDDMGAWLPGGEEYLYGIRNSIYARYKGYFRMPQRMWLLAVGTGNRVTGNEIHDSLMGIWTNGDNANPTAYLQVDNNSIYNIDAFGIALVDGITETDVSYNSISNVNVGMRWHHFNYAISVPRTAHIYRNRFWNPEGIGKHIHIHYETGGTGPIPEYWFYHNSLSGGGYGIYNAKSEATQDYLTNTHIINNIFSTPYFIYCQLPGNFWTDIDSISVFDYNWVFDDNSAGLDASWFSGYNINGAEYVWNITQVPDFILPQDSEAINAGIDVSLNFTIDEETFTSLPGMNTDYFYGSAPDIGAYEYAYHKADTNNDNIINMPELMAFISRWKANATVVSKAEVEEARGIWFGGGGC